MFQVHGIPMLDALGQPVLGVDLSGQVLNELNEDDLADGVLTVQGGGPADVPRPDGTRRLRRVSSTTAWPSVRQPNTATARRSHRRTRIWFAWTVRPTDAIDWLNDGDASDTNLAPQDINFNGGPNSIPPGSEDDVPTDGPFTGSNDWAYVGLHGLKQVGSRPNGGSVVGGRVHGRSRARRSGRGDPGRGDPGRGDPGRGDPGRGDPGRGDPGRGDPGRGDPGAPGGDLDIETATGHAHASSAAAR